LVIWFDSEVGGTRRTKTFLQNANGFLCLSIGQAVILVLPTLRADHFVRILRIVLTWWVDSKLRWCSLIFSRPCNFSFCWRWRNYLKQKHRKNSQNITSNNYIYLLEKIRTVDKWKGLQWTVPLLLLLQVLQLKPLIVTFESNSSRIIHVCWFLRRTLNILFV